MNAITFPDRGSAPSGQAGLHGRDIVCFSHDWDGEPLSKTHLMRILARTNRVLWVNSIGLRTPSASRADLGRAFEKLRASTTPLREVEPNLFVCSPLAVPAYGLSLARRANRELLRWQVRRAMRLLDMHRVVNWVFNPAAAVVAGELGEDLVIYQCVDEYSAFTGVPGESVATLERGLLERADLVIVSAELLRDSKSRLNPRTYLVRHGVDWAHFHRALDDSTVIPAEIGALPRPVIGFFGLIADWVDVGLMADVARQYPQGSLVVLGRATTGVSELEALPNVHLLGRRPYADLPAYCKGFDVALMPFRINELTLNANPLKVREYLAAGLPVVSTAIPEVEVLGLCRIGRDREEFLHRVAEALRDPGPAASRSDAVRHESWEARVDEIRSLIQFSGRMAS